MPNYTRMLHFPFDFEERAKHAEAAKEGSKAVRGREVARRRLRKVADPHRAILTIGVVKGAAVGAALLDFRKRQKE
jgi:hypothetical protein